MTSTSILDEIREVRDRFAQECGYDVDVMLAQLREQEKVAAQSGATFVSLMPQSTPTIPAVAGPVAAEQRPEGSQG